MVVGRAEQVEAGEAGREGRAQAGGRREAVMARGWGLRGIDVHGRDVSDCWGFFQAVFYACLCRM